MIGNLHTLCLVDDDVIHHFIIKKFIKDIKIYREELLIFSNGEEAIEHIKSFSETANALPDLILLDINMPIMDGWEFLDEYITLAPKLKKKIKIYILSSSDNPRDIRRAKEYERISDYLIKPISEAELLSVLKAI